MKKITSVKEYQELKKSARERAHTNINNDFLSESEVERLTGLNRFFYEEYEDGIVFYDDEIRYYNIFYHWNRDKAVNVSPEDKPLVIVHYWKGEKRDRLLSFEEKLKEAGFKNSHLSRHMLKNMDSLKAVVEKTYEFSKMYFDMAGLRLVPPELKHVESFRTLEDSLNEIPFWHFPYQSDEEIVDSGRRGNTVCAVDKDDRVCGAISYFDDDATYGWVGILEEYQKKPGIPIVLYEWSLRRMMERDVKKNGWIAEENVKSNNFHSSIGFTYTGSYKEDWLLWPAE